MMHQIPAVNHTSELVNHIVLIQPHRNTGSLSLLVFTTVTGWLYVCTVIAQ